MLFLMTSLAWPLKGFSIQWTEQAREDQPAHHEDHPTRPMETTALEDALQLHHPHGPERPRHAEPRRSWPQTSLSLRPHQATRTLPPARVRQPFLTGSKWLPRRTPFHTEASCSIYVRTEARERRTQEPPQSPGRKGNTRGRGGST